MKSVSCRDVGKDCDFRAVGNTDQEVLGKIIEHAKSEHGLTEFPEDMKNKVMGAIREDKAAAA